MPMRWRVRRRSGAVSGYRRSSVSENMAFMPKPMITVASSVWRNSDASTTWASICALPMRTAMMPAPSPPAPSSATTSTKIR